MSVHNDYPGYSWHSMGTKKDRKLQVCSVNSDNEYHPQILNKQTLNIKSLNQTWSNDNKIHNLWNIIKNTNCLKTSALCGNVQYWMYLYSY